MPITTLTFLALLGAATGNSYTGTYYSSCGTDCQTACPDGYELMTKEDCDEAAAAIVDNPANDLAEAKKADLLELLRQAVSDSSATFGVNAFSQTTSVDTSTNYYNSCGMYISNNLNSGKFYYSTTPGQWAYSASICKASSTPGANGDPHLHLPHGGVADFRGENGTFYNLLSAVGFSCALYMVLTTHMLPKPLLVHGSFFVKASWVVLGLSGRHYAILADAAKVGFDVLDAQLGTTLAIRHGVWQEYAADGVHAIMKQSTIVVRANGWEVNATRRPIYNLVEGPSEWRFDIAMRKLDGTPFERDFGRASATCFPHGLIGQGFDGDALGVSGKTDDYNSVDPWHPVMWTTAQAEGAIEGVGSDYKLQSAVSTEFKFSRYLRKKGDSCAPRNVTKLLGAKAAHAAGNHEVASASEPVTEPPVATKSA